MIFGSSLDNNLRKIITDSLLKEDKFSFQLLCWAAHSPKSLLVEKFPWRTSIPAERPISAVSRATGCKAWKCSPVETQQRLTGAERSPNVSVSFSSKSSSREAPNAVTELPQWCSICKFCIVYYLSTLTWAILLWADSFAIKIHFTKLFQNTTGPYVTNRSAFWLIKAYITSFPRELISYTLRPNQCVCMWYSSRGSFGG